MNQARKQAKTVTTILVLIVILCTAAGIVSGVVSEIFPVQEAEQNYTLESVEDIEKISKKDKRLKANGVEPGENEVVYLMNILVNNQDTEEISYLSIDAEDQDGNYISCTVLDPYGNFDMGSRSVIPAGVSRKLPVAVSLYREEISNIKSINFYRWDSKGDEKKVCTVLMDEVMEQTE